MDALQTVPPTSFETLTLFRLRVRAESDPAALGRVLQPFQNLNIIPRRLVAELGSHGDLHIQVDVSGLSEERIQLIAAKVSQASCVLQAHWCRI